MDLWWKLTGYTRLRLTSADCTGRLRLLISRGIRLEDIDYTSELTVELSVRSSELHQIKALLRDEDELVLLSQNGIAEQIRIYRKYPIVLLTLAFIIFATFWLNGRILFVRVQGNGSVPAGLILETAAEKGVCFGASRRELRSEAVKNRLLYEIPQLSWVGVNTKGCVATITVHARQQETEGAGILPGSLVAIRDCVVVDVTVAAGRGVCTPGQSVRAGQVLISGYTDLGICTRAVRAEGEVYGITEHKIRAVLPAKTHQAEASEETSEKYALILGKKRINFYSDSGILQGSCGKMREVRWLTLPGGWELPIALVIERCSLTETAVIERTAAEPLLAASVHKVLQTDMIAGQILDESVQTYQDGALWVLEGEYQCREMIARLRQGVFLEGDTNDDRENGERGAG